MKKNKSYYINFNNKSQPMGKTVEREILFSEDSYEFELIKKSVPCQEACPAKTNIPAYIRTLYEGRYNRSYEINRFVNIFPGILGRICSRPCENNCRHGLPGLGESVSICQIKRAAADFKSTGHLVGEKLFAYTHKKIAIVGAGPAGMACAHDLAKLGHKIDMFESMPMPGGMLKYGIPRFRLPQKILDYEFYNIFRLGVNIYYNKKLGENLDLNELLKNYDAVILSCGCDISNKMHLPGEDSSIKGIYYALDFMYKFNENQKLEVGENCFILGGGFTAMDCVRAAKRLGAKNVSMNILSTEKYLTIPKNELLAMKEEKIKINSLLVAKEFIIENNKLKKIKFQRTKIDKLLDNLRVKTAPIPGSEFYLDADSVIIAIGQKSDYDNIFPFKVKRTKNGYIKLNENFSYIDNAKLFFAGDFYNGSSTVIKAIGHSREISKKVDEFLTKKIRKKWMIQITPYKPEDRQRTWDFIPRQKVRTVETEKSLKNKFMEVEKGFDKKTAGIESQRCYLCSLNFEIRVEECIYCMACIEVMPRKCILKVKEIETDENGKILKYIEADKFKDINAIVIDNKECIRCGACYRVCPVKCIQVTKKELIDLDIEK